MNLRKSKWITFLSLGIIALLLLGVWLLWLSPSVDSASFPQRPEDYPDFVAEHHFSVLALGDDLSPCRTMDAYQFLHEHYGDVVLTWGVQEISGVNYVMAYPSRGPTRFSPTQRKLMRLLTASQEPAFCEVGQEELAMRFPVINP